ncbi:GNAT family N-acetyltransferase [Nonomuraea sp. NPDC026600]|uniref:GNAT family N-acetyltransferase n=1 Tax=Nonomuraea sp. NPDC026600 TaxID=3155363 RepID=UPI0033F83998
MPSDIRCACRADVAAITELLTDAIAPLPPTAYAVPNPADRHRVLAAVLRMEVEFAIDEGVVDVIDYGPIGDESDVRLHLAGQGAGDGPAAVALWWPRTEPLAELLGIPDYDHRLNEAAGPYADRFRELSTLRDKYRPTASHDELAYLAVTRAYRRRGLARRLLAQHTRRDEAVYVNVCDLAAVELFQRRGYTIREAVSLPTGREQWGPVVGLPRKGQTLFWSMWRPADDMT